MEQKEIGISRPEPDASRGYFLVAAVLFCVLFAVGASCDDAGRRDGPSLLSGNDSIGFTALGEGPRLCGNCIRLKRIALLGDTADPGMLLDTWLRVVKDSVGNYWIGQRNTVKVFTGNGKFLRDIGRAGTGPFEFATPGPIQVDGDGRVHILDVNNRETVVSPDFTYYADLLWPVLPRQLAPLPGGDRYVASMWVATPERIGLPFHIIDAGRLTHSFGLVQHNAAAESQFSSRRIIAVDGEGKLLAASRPYDYSIEFWTTTGKRLAGLVGKPLNAKPVLPGRLSDDNPPANEIQALWLDGQRRVWVVSWRPKPNWRSFMKDTANSFGRRILTMKERGTSYQEVFTCRIDVIDLNKKAIIARHDGETMFAGFIGHEGLLFAREFTPDGTMHVGIWRIDFTL